MGTIKKRLLSLCLGFVLTLGVGVGLSGTHNEATKVYAADGTLVTLTSADSVTTDDGLTVTFAKNTGSNAPAWYAAGLRLYQGNTLTFDASSNITSVTFIWEKQGNKNFATVKADVGTYSHPTAAGEGVWSGSSNKIVFTLSSSAQLQLNKFYYVLEASETYTISFDSNGGSGIMDNVSAGGQYTLPESTFTAPTGKAFAGWKANNEGDAIAVGDKYTVSADTTFYAQWANSYSVTYTGGENGTGSYVDSNKPEGTYTLPAFEDLTGITANSGYQFYNYSVNGETKYPDDEITLSGDTSIDVIFDIEKLSTTYDFTKNFSTYASSWNNSYAKHTGLNGKTTIGGKYEATIDLYYVSKQGNTMTNMPVFATKTASGSWTKVLQFTLNESGYKIDSITVTFAQWTTKTPSVSLYKGADATGTALDTAKIGTKNTLTTSNFNGTIFTVGYSDDSTSNVQSGLQSIFIEISSADTFGTLDHIKIEQEPTKTVYHVGETFDSTGLSVKAYDGANEDTANFKDVTSEVEMLLDNTYTFKDTDVPGMDEEVTYEGETATFHVYVYETGEYSLVTKNLNNWSGKYLIVGVDKNSDSKTVAMDSYLSAPDNAKNYETIDDSTTTITAGRELEWTISSMDGGYSIKGQSGKYIGSPTTKTNGMLVGDEAILNTISLNETSGEVTIKGTSDYCLNFNKDSSADRFRYYAKGTVKLYRLEDTDDDLLDAEIYAENFNAVIGCDSDGLVEPTGWEYAIAEWNETSVGAQVILSNVDLSTETNEEIKQCITTYEYIINKYNGSNPEKYYDFMGRNLVSTKSNIVYKTTNSNTPILIVVLVSFVSVTAIGGYLFLRKRRIN